MSGETPHLNTADTFRFQGSTISQDKKRTFSLDSTIKTAQQRTDFLFRVWRLSQFFSSVTVWFGSVRHHHVALSVDPAAVSIRRLYVTTTQSLQDAVPVSVHWQQNRTHISSVSSHSGPIKLIHTFVSVSGHPAVTDHIQMAGKFYQCLKPVDGITHIHL